MLPAGHGLQIRASGNSVFILRNLILIKKIYICKWEKQYPYMKTKETKQKSVLTQLRDIRDKLSVEIKDMSYQQLKEYLDKQKTLHKLSHEK